MWFIFKNKECTGELSSTKMSGRPQKATKVKNSFLSLKKPVFITSSSQEHLRRSAFIVEVYNQEMPS